MLFKKSLIIPIAVICLLSVDYFYFNQLRDNYAGGSVSEGFLRKGRLGEILNQNNLLKISPDSAHLAKNDMCARKDYFNGFDYHNSFRMRFKLLSKHHEYVHVKLQILKAKRYRRVETEFTVNPGKNYYDLDFFADKNRDIKITFSTHLQSSLSIEEIIIDGQYGRSYPLVLNGEPIIGNFKYAELASKNIDRKIEKKTYYSASKALSPKLFSGTFPGKKKIGFCRYVSNLESSRKSLSPLLQNNDNFNLPKVNIEVDQEKLYGSDGLFNNKEKKGILWEVPALMSINDGQDLSHQQVGLRFHGGKPGRKKDILSFRANARRHYGISEIDTKKIFGKPRKVGAKGVVFKYTYQAYGEQKINYNPFNHAFALDIANAIGAIVPPHRLVDFNINNQPQGLFLAMEHLSERTIKNWLKNDDFTLYTYKKFNKKVDRDKLLIPLGNIINSRGENTFALLKKNYDIDNVINSILLSAYIADDDYCQGVEIIEHASNPVNAKITSINWDLDHAFLSYNFGHFSMPAKHIISPAFAILMQNKNLRENLCPRKWAYAHVYQQSAEFRKLIRTRLQQLLAEQLSPLNLEKMLNQYRLINQHYFDAKYNDIIKAFSNFIKKRPKILLNELNALEQSILANATISQ